MGAAAGRIWSKGLLGGFGTPAAPAELQRLLGWSREDLQQAFQKFRSQPSLAVCKDVFEDILGFDSSNAADIAFQHFKPKQHRVDMLAVFGAMVATSDQRMISRVSFLFSMFDLDNNGFINRPEFVIAMRSLLSGLSCVFQSAILPSKREFEELTVAVFDRIDEDKSDLISLGELLSYAYRSAELKQILQPFPHEDARIFEDLVDFSNSDEFTAAVNRASIHMESKIQMQLEIANSRRSISFRPGPPKRPKDFTKAHGWFVYKVFVQLGGGGVQRTIPSDELQRWVQDPHHIQDILGTVSAAAADLLAPRQRLGSNRERTSVCGQPADLEKLSNHIKRYFQDRHAVAKLDALGEGSISLRAFLCVLLPSLPEREIETCLRWCACFRAHDILQEYLSGGQVQGLDSRDVQLIFSAFDFDGNGHITVEELMKGGDLTEEQAQRVIHRLDDDGSGSLSFEELHGILRTIHTTLRAEFRTAFECERTGSKSRAPGPHS